MQFILVGLYISICVPENGKEKLHGLSCMYHHEVCMEETKNTYTILVRNSKQKNYLENLVTGGRIILK
jgi:hypothetical protein